MHTWLNANELALNMTKTEFMLIGPGQKLDTIATSPSILMNGTRVRQVATAKSPGRTIDDKLSWNCNIEKLTKTIASGIGAMIRVRHLAPPATLHLMYQALMQPHFDHCSTVWGTCGVTLQDKLQKLQNRAARVLTFANYDVNAGQLREILGWKNLDSQRNIQKATMVFKCLHGLAPDYLASKFSERNTSYNLRDSENKLNVRLPRTNYFKNSFSYSGATQWNRLPCKARCAESLRSFKREISKAR